MRAVLWAVLLVPGVAFGQSAPLTGPNAAAVHGQAPAGRQNLSAPAAPSAAPAAPRRQAVTGTRPRTRNTSPLGTVIPRTATGPEGGRVSASERRHEAQLNEARRRQRAAEARATAARDGVLR
jgi:hypothetical protein